MCGCSNFVENEGLNFSGNRPSIVEVGEDSSFEYFTGNRPSVVEVGEDPSFDFVGDLDGSTQFDDFIGKKARARRQERRARRRGDVPTGEEAGAGAGAETRAVEADADKNAYGSSSWISNNWIYLVIGVAVIGGGFYYFKKRK
jgi:LPXTG-motif cell wall-anchored protein